MNNPNSTIWKVAAGVRYRHLLDEAVLTHPGRDEALVLNETGIAFIEACDGARTVGQIIDLMAEAFDVRAEQLATDLEPFIDRMASEGVIEAVGEQP
jgi:pyrroloquinoline quinone biosynthesis protein D